MTSDNGSPIEVLELEDASRFAKTVSSTTSKKILSLLESKDGLTASEISSRLDIALSTVHYHLKSLCKAGVVDDTSFHYSEKGKEVIHYSLHDKAIIIIPRKKRSSTSLKEQLKAIVPGILVTTGVVFGLSLFDLLKNGGRYTVRAPARQMDSATTEGVMRTADTATASSSQASFISQLAGSPEFFVGVGCTILIIVLTMYVRSLLKRVKNRP